MMERPFRKAIAAARPSLFSASPLLAHTILTYAIFNILLLPAFLASKPFEVIIPLWAWGWVFAVLGIWMMVSLFQNYFDSLRFSLLTGVSIKVVWLIALLLERSWAVALLWTAFVWLQILCVIYFPYSGGVRGER